jgi:branched-chain amino acid transport system substrate-binding protein
MTTKKVPVLVFLMIIVLLDFGSQVSTGQDVRPVRIGVLAPQTGNFANFGKQMFEGITLAAEQNNYMAGDHPIELIFEDTRLDNEIAVSRARKLDEQDKVDLIIGPVSGGEGLSVLNWARESGVPVIVSYSAPEDITMRLAVRNVIRNSWTGAQPMDPYGYWVATELGYRRIYAIGQDYSFPYNQIGGFKRGFCRGGGELVTTVWHPTNTEDFSSIIAAIPTSGYDAVMYNGAGADGVAFVRQYVDFGMLDVYPLLGQSNTFEQSDLPAMPIEIAGSYSAIQYVESLQTPEFIDFFNAYQERWGRAPAAAAEHAYTALVMAIRAIEGLENIDDREALIDALRATNYPDAPRGPFYLDEFANPVQNIYIRQVQIVDGKLVNVGLFTVPAVSQFGPYDPELYMAQPRDARDYPPDRCADMPREMLEVENKYEFIPMAPLQ